MLKKAALASIVALSCINTPVFAIQNEVQDQTVASCSYDSKENTYSLENVTVEEVLSAFEESEDFELKSLVVDRAGTYYADYYVRGYYTGINRESVPINWTCNMVMTSVLVNGTSYGKFVSLNLGPTLWLGSNSYTVASQSNAAYSINSKGTVLSVSQTVQLQTATGYSASVGASAGWANVGASTSGTYYFRGPARTVSGSYTLPLAIYI